MNRGRTLVAGGAVMLAAAMAGPLRAAPASAAETCAGLDGLAVPASAIGLPTRGGQVRQAVLVPASGQGATAVGEYCRVEAALHPVDPAAPDILMRIALPTAWNGKTMMFGGGGYDGTIPNIAGNVPYGLPDRPTPLGRGYATFASDSGHQAAPGFQPATSLDGSFAVNDEALRNFAGDALKKTRDAAVHLIGRRYGGAVPARGYFAGGSSGGREALAVAQRWPRDFQGVIAAYPAWNAAALDLFFGYEAQILSRPGAFPGPAEQDLLHRSVIAACDAGDGVRDGIVSNERGCRFDPRVLRCAGRHHEAGTCLTDRQIRAVRALSAPLRLPYRIASGETGYPGFPFLSGAAMTTPLLGMGTAAPADPMPKSGGYGVQFWDQWIRYAVTRDPGHASLAVDPRRPGRWRARISELSALQDVKDPDLRRFAAAGGRLLLVHGLADELVSHRSTAQYFARVRATMGARATNGFARFYTVPGANHANVKADFTAGWDSLTVLEDWAENGAPPRDPVVRDTGPAAAGRARPLCEYPAWPRYKGSGDPGDAGSFTCRGG